MTGLIAFLPPKVSGFERIYFWESLSVSVEFALDK
jgi:hypothetical protein